MALAKFRTLFSHSPDR